MTAQIALRRGDVTLGELDPSGPNTIRKRRPVVIVSPDDLNADEFTYIVAPLTTGNHPYRFRIPCEFSGKKGYVVLDMLYTLDARAVGPAIGRLKAQTMNAALLTLREMFEE